MHRFFLGSLKNRFCPSFAVKLRILESLGWNTLNSNQGKKFKIMKLALKNKTTLKHEALKSKLISEKDYNKIVDPKKMIYPA